MNDDLQRLRNDLDVIQQSVGGKVPFAWTDVRLNLLLAVAGGLTVVMAWGMAWAVPGGKVRWTVAPIAFVTILMLRTMRRVPTEDSIQAARRRRARLDWMATGVVMIVLLPYLLWESHLGDLTRMVACGAGILFSGMTCAALAVTAPARRYYWGYALPLVVWGALFHNESLRGIVIGGGAMCFFAGLLAAAIQSLYLRREGA